jgi:ribonuclease D
VKKPTFIGRSEWDDYPLRDEQVQYASVDAFLSFKMGKALHVWNWNR